MAEKNLAALVRKDTFTVDVSFEINPNATNKQLYRYVSNIPLKEGDLVVVPYSSRSHQNYNPDVPNRWTIVRVVHVHDIVDIEPNSDIYYKFVAAKVDLSHYNKTMEENAKMDQAMAVAYRKSAQDQFRDRVMQYLPQDIAEIANKPLQAELPEPYRGSSLNPYNRRIGEDACYGEQFASNTDKE